MLAAPISGPTTNAAAWFGAIARSAIEAPNAIAVTPTRRTELSVRRATASAPTSDPRLSTENSQVKVASVPPRSPVTNSGTTTWKLNARVPIDGHHHQRHPHRRDAAHVAEALADLALRRREGRRSAARHRSHHGQQPDEHGDVGEAVDQERPAEPDGRDEQPGERRADDP